MPLCTATKHKWEKDFLLLLLDCVLVLCLSSSNYMWDITSGVQTARKHGSVQIWVYMRVYHQTRATKQVRLGTIIIIYIKKTKIKDIIK